MGGPEDETARRGLRIADVRESGNPAHEANRKIRDAVSRRWQAEVDARCPSAALPAVLLVLAGCAEPASVPAPAPRAPVQRPVEANRPPVADAGPDQRAREGDNVVLNGTGSTDPDGTIVSFRWTPRRNDEVTIVLENAETLTPSFVVPDLEEDTTFVFDLVVVDDQGASSSDATQVYVTTYDDL